ncbi:hypothetical protein HanXRQr2_Chr03g0121321 [Helianthus annuus]|uniref:Uncharacterized protein n=1 Tax=Helianthus annuus TaxID=4232 RepID=A0A9K3JHW7_HELAN|nr:hypothetical protein HanXRQr2_Chr03g0121321 [Helianthus annuus]
MDPSLASACTNSQQLRDLPLSNEKRDVTSTTTLSLNKANENFNEAMINPTMMSD